MQQAWSGTAVQLQRWLNHNSVQHLGGHLCAGESRSHLCSVCVSTIVRDSGHRPSSKLPFQTQPHVISQFLFFSERHVSWKQNCSLPWSFTHTAVEPFVSLSSASWWHVQYVLMETRWKKRRRLYDTFSEMCEELRRWLFSTLAPDCSSRVKVSLSQMLVFFAIEDDDCWTVFCQCVFLPLLWDIWGKLIFHV